MISKLTRVLDETSRLTLTLAFGLRAMQKLSDDDLERIRPNLGWIPTEVMQQTLPHTIQFAKDVVCYPVHFARQCLRVVLLFL